MSDKLFRCESSGGRVVLLGAKLLSRRGSWIEIEINGRIIKENGMFRWHETVMEAMEQFVTHRARCLTLNSMSENHEQFINDIVLCIEESFSWGELVGAINGLKDDQK